MGFSNICKRNSDKVVDRRYRLRDTGSLSKTKRRIFYFVEYIAVIFFFSFFMSN